MVTSGLLLVTVVSDAVPSTCTTVFLFVDSVLLNVVVEDRRCDAVVLLKSTVSGTVGERLRCVPIYSFSIGIALSWWFVLLACSNMADIVMP